MPFEKKGKGGLKGGSFLCFSLLETVQNSEPMQLRTDFVSRYQQFALVTKLKIRIFSLYFSEGDPPVTVFWKQ